jgi:hypothetical protein
VEALVEEAEISVLMAAGVAVISALAEAVAAEEAQAAAFQLTLLPVLAALLLPIVPVPVTVRLAAMSPPAPRRLFVRFVLFVP